ncbi:MAG: hypothetical protein E6Q98_01460 [Rhodospirillaceae bacterium]|nr:MAG: hypothetical protein E6Q98_01460 [Rhodospirillaceae bacterium]
MVTTQNRKRVIAATAFLAGLTLSGAGAFAETHHDRPDRPTEKTITTGNSSQDSLGRATGSTATNSETQQKLDQMAANCDRMMESMRSNSMMSRPEGSTGLKG